MIRPPRMRRHLSSPPINLEKRTRSITRAVPVLDHLGITITHWPPRRTVPGVIAGEQPPIRAGRGRAPERCESAQGQGEAREGSGPVLTNGGESAAPETQRQMRATPASL